ncbi:hypothetical protein [uncultured Deinococcus sp.]|uniref:hypothetical protein n=1 Tax=uncultured Deinococcus sp. TaxID=158789 RepID=UPI00345B66E9
MHAAVPHARVTDYQHLMPGLHLPDPDDRHVLAAALHSGARSLITFNLSDLPVAAVPGTTLTVVHPDSWLVPVLAHTPQATGRVLRRLVAPFREPPLTTGDVAIALIQLKLPQSAAVLQGLLDQGIC